DEEAASEFVRDFEPALLASVRTRLGQHHLEHVLDATDITQSVLARFFVRAGRLHFRVANSDQLRGLLRTMARNQVLDELRRYRTGRRDLRRVAQEDLHRVAGGEPTPSRVVAGRELLEEVRRRFTDEERHLLDERSLGLDWANIAATHGEPPQVLRKRLNRAVHRVLRQLQLDE